MLGIIIISIFIILVFLIIFFIVYSKRKKNLSINKTINKSERIKTKIDHGLHRIKVSFGQKILNIFHLKKNLDDFFDELEEVLISSDVGIETTLEILEKFKNIVEKKQISDEIGLIKEFKLVLKNMILDKKFELIENKLNILFVFGVNGVGKTTTIAKLGNLFKNQGKKVLIAACDTFRAAATKQLTKWAYSIDVQIVKHNEGGSPGAVLYDAIDAALSRKIDVLIVDTAGRFHNRHNLMQELEKLNRIIDKKISDCKKNNILVLDATTGHNAFIQAKEFREDISVDGIILAKLDSSAKGGIVLPISHKLNIPIYFIGIGEKVDDIIDFNRETYIESII